MRKYLLLLSLSWQNGFVYRTSLLLWRFRNMLSTLMSLTVWSLIFSGPSQGINYQPGEMLTYILLVSVLQSVIMATLLHGLSGRIYNGDISNELLKPVNFFAYLGVQELADKFKNIIFAIIEGAILWWIFQPVITLPSVQILGLFIIWVLGGAWLFFCIQLLMASFGFWSPETWGPRFLFFTIAQLTAGKLFPLDILPQLLQSILAWTPFPYLSYAQIQLFLNRLDPTEIWQFSLGLLGWIVITMLGVAITWRKGLHDYAAAGR